MILYPIIVSGRGVPRAFYWQPKQLSGSLAGILKQSDVLTFIWHLPQGNDQGQVRVYIFIKSGIIDESRLTYNLRDTSSNRAISSSESRNFMAPAFSSAW